MADRAGIAEGAAGRMRPSPRAAGSGKRRARIAAGAVSLLVFVAFCPVLANGFVNWDDDLYVGWMQSVHLSFSLALRLAFARNHPSGNWHPITTLSHAADYTLWGMHPAGHHLTSIVLHACNAGLLVLLGCALLDAHVRTSRQGQTGWTSRHKLAAGVVAGLLWGLHPLRVESVAWISERKDLLCGFFCLLALHAYLRYAAEEADGSPGRARRRYLAVLAWFVLALLSKPMAVSLPFVLLVLDCYPLRRTGRGRLRHLVVEKIPFLLLAAASAVVTLYAQRADGAFQALASVPLPTRILVALRALALYLGKTVFPVELLPLYAYPRHVHALSFRFGLPILSLALLTVASIALARRHGALAAAWAIFAGMLVPVLGIVQVGPQAMADRYTYLPGMALALLLASAWAGFLHRGAGRRWAARVAGAAPVLVFVALAGLSARQIGVWHDSGSLWSYDLRYQPWDTEAYNNRASYYFDQGEYRKALADYDAALSVPPDLSPVHATERRSAYFNDRAITDVRLGRYLKALADEGQAIKLRPDDGDYYRNRGDIDRVIGDRDPQDRDWQRAETLWHAAAARARIGP